MRKLRPYQEEAILEIKELFKKGVRRVVLCKPTGAGKTVTFSELCRQTIGRKGTTIIATHRAELMTQAGAALFDMGVHYEKINQKSKKHIPHSNCYIAMIKTLVSRKNTPAIREIIERATLVIADECHLGDLRPVTQLFDGKHIIGATATPLSANKREPLNKFYQDIVIPVQTSELIEAGFLVNAKLASFNFDRGTLSVDKGEYSEQSQIMALKVSKLYDGVVEKYLHHAPGRRAICFNVNIEHSKEVRDKFLAAGISCEHVDGTTEDEDRIEIFKRFRRNEFQVLCNVGIATAGFDDPEVSCIIFNRATKSMPLWLQCCGRGSRLFPGKKDFVIIDMASNWKELGMWQSDRNWYELFHNPRQPGEGVAPSKMCPGQHPTGDYCECIVPASTKVCPYCEYEWPEAEKRLLDVDFAWIDESHVIKLQKPPRSQWSTFDTFKLAEYVTTGTYSTAWAKYRIFDRCETKEQALEELQLLGVSLGYKKGWEKYQVLGFKKYKEENAPVPVN